MFRRLVTKSQVIAIILVVQFVPIMIYPASSFSTTSQEWWFPALLSVLSIIGAVELLVNRKSVAIWGWQLISFAQGFNLISRLLLLFPHFTYNKLGVQVFNGPYVILTAVAMLLSVFMLWYIELPEVRTGLLTD